MKGYCVMQHRSPVRHLSCYCRFSLGSHKLPLKSFWFSVALCEGWLWLLLIRCSKLKNFTEKWQSLSQIWTVKAQHHSFLANWINWTFSSHNLLSLFDRLENKTLPWLHCTLWSAFGLLRKFQLSLTLSHFYYCISVWLCPKQNIRIRSLALYAGAHTLTTSTGIWHSAGVPKGVTSPAAHRGR